MKDSWRKHLKLGQGMMFPDAGATAPEQLKQPGKFYRMISWCPCGSRMDDDTMKAVKAMAADTRCYRH